MSKESKIFSILNYSYHKDVEERTFQSGAFKTIKARNFYMDAGA
jgi:hypothetical protein